MTQTILQVDAFTATPFTGNPAGVCVLQGPATEVWMRDVAREMNLSETAFLYPDGDEYRLRWFTPAAEVALCGHATLASAHVLWSEGHLSPGMQARFQTLSGLLTADKEGDWIKLDFPGKSAVEADAPAGMLEALGADGVKFVGKNVFDYIVELESEADVRKLQPDFGRLQQVQARGVMVTARADSDEFDFVSRFFAPAVGVPEDPVTGSAHCCLTPYWAEKLGKDEMIGYQASARGGVVKVAKRGDRVWLYGQAITMLKGELLA